MNRPVIILGAGRSGTKFLRGLLAHHPDFRAVPYDVNHVWMAEAADPSHDEAGSGDLTPQAVKRLRCRLESFGGRYGSGHGIRLVEKTVSNTLRVPLVNRVFPDAMMLHIIRDGRDVVESASRVWNQPVGLRYALGKLGYYSPSEAAKLLRRAILPRALGRLGRRPSPLMWGPRYRGYQIDLERESIPLVASRQWKSCVRSACAGLQDIGSDRRLTLSYEALVSDPSVVEAVARFLGCDPEPLVLAYQRSVRHDRVGRFAEALTPDVRRQVVDELTPLLRQLKTRAVLGHSPLSLDTVAFRDAA